MHALRHVREAHVAACELVLGEHLPRPRALLEMIVEGEVHLPHSPALGFLAERGFGARRTAAVEHAFLRAHATGAGVQEERGVARELEARRLVEARTDEYRQLEPPAIRAH